MTERHKPNHGDRVATLTPKAEEIIREATPGVLTRWVLNPPRPDDAARPDSDGLFLIGVHTLIIDLDLVIDWGFDLSVEEYKAINRLAYERYPDCNDPDDPRVDTWDW